MKTTTPSLVALGVAGTLYNGIVSGATVSSNQGDSEDIQFSWGVPEQSSSSGSGNVYFQLTAPDTYSWVGLGIGSGMRGAEMFLMYQDGSGNVTLSTRQGEGHVMPQYTSRDNVELLAGSGVTDGKMVANVRCGDCNSLDMTSSNSWIAAWHTGESLDSSDTDAQISVHSGVNVFNVDFSQASISSDANPFVNSDGTTTSGNSGDNGAVTQSEDNGPSDTILLAHGVIMTIVFIALYPIGSLLMPLLNKWFIHAGVQFLAYLLMWAGFGLGYSYAKPEGYFFNQAHTRLGTIVVALLGVQPLLGWLHHMHFQKNQQRGIVSHLHIWYGRILIVLGIVTGGLGLELTGNTSGSWLIAYCVVAGIVAAAYLGAAVFGMLRGRRSPQVKSPPMSESRSSA